jgi:two-component system C4-dicarboxylate transport sensor histidine kinase DctB
MARRVAAPVIRPGRSFAIAVLGSILALGLFWFAVSRWASERALANAELGASQMARTQVGLLASELQKFRLLPLVLTEYPDVRMVLEDAGPDVVARLNGKLELLSSRTDAAAIYLIDRNGRTVAASNWRLPTSFVGQVYGFRPYFQDALRSGAAELFALGTVSGRPGLFIARRVESEGRILGVIVVKVEFDRLEAAWSRQPGPTFVTDRHGVIIITSRPDWRFRSTRPLGPAEMAQIRSARQFGTLPLPPLGLAADGAALREDAVRFLPAEVPTGLEGGRLHYLNPLAPDEAGAAATTRAAILAALVLVVLALALLYRAREKRQLQDEARRALESEVALRTAELRETNDQLTEQSRERERSDLRYRSAREELAQANRLGSIGQITAGVAHEINQPVAAIRTFAENAGTFLDQDKPERARSNLGLIVELTARIGAITAELRGFARRGAPAIDAVEIAPVVDGALLLIGDRVRAVGAIVEREGEQAGIRVVADRVRLEQVVINLLQNALDALEGQSDPLIRISVTYADRVTIEVDDNGPGIPADIADQLFTPFVTGRPDGLGLGLGIARDIAREFGGDLDLAPSALGGTALRITLRRA